MTVHAERPWHSSMVPLTVWGFRCAKCGHEWLPRLRDHVPVVCAACKNRNWQGGS